MSVVNPFAKLFPRRTAGDASAGQDSLAAASYQSDGMQSVQGEPSALPPSPEGDFAEEDLISLPLLGRATAAAHQRRLLTLLAVGVVVLALGDRKSVV